VTVESKGKGRADRSVPKSALLPPSSLDTVAHTVHHPVHSITRLDRAGIATTFVIDCIRSRANVERLGAQYLCRERSVPVVPRFANGDPLIWSTCSISMCLHRLPRGANDDSRVSMYARWRFRLGPVVVDGATIPHFVTCRPPYTLFLVICLCE